VISNPEKVCRICGAVCDGALGLVRHQAVAHSEAEVREAETDVEAFHRKQAEVLGSEAEDNGIGWGGDE
jgi:cellobiose-specific phosphotransferase system component IIA